MFREKKLLIIGVAGLILLAGLIVLRLIVINTPEQTGPIEVQEAPLSQNESEENQQNEETPEEVKAFIELLSNTVFSDGSQSNYLVFSETSFNVYENGNITSAPYSIHAIKTETLSNEEASVERYTATFETNEETYVLTLDKDPSTGKVGAISCDAFGSKTVWVATEKTGEVIVSDPNPNVASLINGKTEELRKTIVDYCNANRPLAISAIPSEGVYINYSQQTIQMSYTLTPTTQNPLSVTYNMADQSFSVSEM